MNSYKVSIFLLFSIFLCSKVILTQNSNYFQQEVNYIIEATLNDKNHTLSAEQKITYTNNSNTELGFLWFHLWPNAYKNHETALAKQLLENGATKFYFSTEEERGYIDSLKFNVNGKIVKWEYHPEHIDICKIYLNEPLKKGESITIETPFFVKIPKGIYSRLGHMGESYQLTQWYPKPAVFDYKGWHEMPYLNQGEFYSEFGSFDVKITLPENYVVGATGDLQNKEELTWLNAKAEKTAKLLSDSTFEFDKDNWKEFPKSSTSLKTLHYEQKNVHDFAFFADKRWHVLKGEVELPNSKKKVTTWSMFTKKEADLWENSIEYLNDAIYYYSLWNGDYPYKQMTAVDGALTAGGGMEYPNVTVIGTSGNAFGLETVIMHETGHQWFYGILGSNERDFPWMDEGINSFNELRYIQTKYPEATLLGTETPKIAEKVGLNIPQRLQYYLGYLIAARENTDQPLSLGSEYYTNYNYAAMVYLKTAASFYYLQSYLGEETFDKIMKRYFALYKFKHPYPEDLKTLFEKETQKDLSWFFDGLLATSNKVEYKAKGVKKINNSNYQLKIKNLGKINAPILIQSNKEDGSSSKKWIDWNAPEGERIQTQAIEAETKSIEINPNIEMLELSTANNRIKTNGLFKKVEPLQIKPLYSLENGKKTQVFGIPTIGWNEYDKIMLGVGIYNSFLPKQKFEYQLFPMYSISNKQLNGYGNIAYNLNLTSSKVFKDIKVGIHEARYSFFNGNLGNATFIKTAPYVELELKKKQLRSPINSVIKAQFFNLNESYNNTSFINNYGRISYNFKKKNAITPFELNGELEQKFETSDSQTSFTKISAEAIQKFRYNKKGSRISARFFAGGFLSNQTANPRYNFRMDGDNGSSNSGILLDYTYDNLFLGRSETEGILFQQFYNGQGNFKIATPLGQSNEWITALNIKIDAPNGRWLGLYSDFGYNSNKTFMASAGAYVTILGGLLEVYLPLAYSENIKNVPSFSSKKYLEKVRFVINFNNLNVFKSINIAR